MEILPKFCFLPTKLSSLEKFKNLSGLLLCLQNSLPILYPQRQRKHIKDHFLKASPKNYLRRLQTVLNFWSFLGMGAEFGTQTPGEPTLSEWIPCCSHCSLPTGVGTASSFLTKLWAPCAWNYLLSLRPHNSVPCMLSLSQRKPEVNPQHRGDHGCSSTCSGPWHEQSVEPPPAVEIL